MRVTRSKFLQILTAATIGLAMPGLAFAQTPKKYVFVTGGDFSPYDMTNPDGSFYGFEIDLLKEIATRAKFDYEIRQMAWDGMMQSLMDGKFDAIIYGVTITDERLKVVDFSLPYTSELTSFVTVKEAGVEIPKGAGQVKIDSDEGKAFIQDQVLPALQGKTIGVEAGSTQAEFVKTYFGDRGVQIREYQGIPQSYADLQNGRVDVVVAAETSLADFVEKNKDSAEIVGPGYTGGSLGQGLAIVAKKGNSELINPINEALKQMKADGTLVALCEKWFGRDLSPTY